MTFPKSNLEKTSEPFRLAILAAAKQDPSGTLTISTREFYTLATQHGLTPLDAKKIATGQTKTVIVLGMATQFTAVALQTASNVIRGMPMKVTSEEEAQRRSICAGCDYFLPEQSRCSECGCASLAYLPDKWQYFAATCPKGKWPAPTPPKSGD